MILVREGKSERRLKTVGSKEKKAEEAGYTGLQECVYSPFYLKEAEFFTTYVSLECHTGTSASTSPSSQQQYFISRPHDVEVIEGTPSIELECRVGNLMGRVQWSKDGFLLG